MHNKLSRLQQNNGGIVQQHYHVIWWLCGVIYRSMQSQLTDRHNITCRMAAVSDIVQTNFSFSLLRRCICALSCNLFDDENHSCNQYHSWTTQHHAVGKATLRLQVSLRVLQYGLFVVATDAVCLSLYVGNLVILEMCPGIP